MKRISTVLVVVVVLLWICGSYLTSSPLRSNHSPGYKLDSLHGVYIYYNGNFTDTFGRNTIDGYNVGLKYQCVEFVKRYYLFHYEHKMPNPWGHAKQFFNPLLEDGAHNSDRNLYQMNNGSSTKPKVGDILIFDGHSFNPYGHVAIISEVSNSHVSVAQQNVGTSTREKHPFQFIDNKYVIGQSDVLGWLSLHKP